MRCNSSSGILYIGFTRYIDRETYENSAIRGSKGCTVVAIPIHVASPPH